MFPFKGNPLMTKILSNDSLFPTAMLPSLTSLACFSFLQMWGVNTSLHIATASAALVFCSRQILGDPGN
jgi:hypothetical protein